MGATFGGTLIQRADFSMWFDVRKGLKETPKTRGKNTVIPGTRGEIPRNRVASKLDIELYGWIKGSSWSAYWTLVKELLTIFGAEAGEKTLVVPLDDGTNATIQARALNVMEEGDEAIGAAQYFSIALEAVNPPNWTFVAAFTGSGQVGHASAVTASGSAQKKGSASAVAHVSATVAQGTKP